MPSESTARSLRSRAMRCLEAQAFGEAAELLTQEIELHPDSVSAFRLRGIARSELGDNAGALADLSRAVELAPDDATSWARRAELRVATGDLAAAAVDIQRALELDPRSFVVWAARGTMRSRDGDLPGAEADLSHALQLQPDSAPLWTARANVRYERGDVSGALADVARAVELDTADAYARARQTEFAVAAGDNELVVAVASRLIELDPDNPWAYDTRGFARAEIGDLDGAIADLSRAIELDPEDGWAWRARGGARADGGDFEGALTDLSRATELRPDDDAAWTNRGRVLLGLGDAQTAIVDFTRALELGGVSAYNYAMRAKARLRASDFEYLLGRMATDPVSSETLIGLASKAPGIAEAFSDMQEALERDAQLAVSVLSGSGLDPSTQEMEHLTDVTRWLLDDRPGDLERIRTALTRSIQVGDAWERLAQLVTLEPALQMRRSKRVPGADVIHAAAIDLIIQTADEIAQRERNETTVLDDLRDRMVVTRGEFDVGSDFEREVDDLKTELTRALPNPPATG